MRKPKDFDFMPLYGDALKRSCVELAATIDQPWEVIQGTYLAMIWVAWQHDGKLIGENAREIARRLNLKSPTLVDHILTRFWVKSVSRVEPIRADEKSNKNNEGGDRHPIKSVSPKSLHFFTQRRVGEELASARRRVGELSRAGKKGNEIKWGPHRQAIATDIDISKKVRTNVGDGTNVNSSSQNSLTASGSARDARATPIDATQPKLFETNDDETPPTVETMSLDDLGEVWNNFAEINDLPKIEALTSRRKSALKARVAEIGGADAWCRLITERVGRSNFLMGKVPPRGDRRKPFRIDFDWLHKPDNFAKVREGKYSNEQPEEKTLR